MYYGISYPDTNGKIQYYAENIQDYMQNLNAIGNCFQQLISQSDIDPEAYCIEWYKTRTEVQCMVRIKE